MKQTLLLMLALICLNAKAATAEPIMTMTTAKNVGETISFTLSANIDNTVVQVDFGDGTLVDRTIKTISTSVSGTLIGTQTVKIYGTGIKALGCNSEQLIALDVTKNTALTSLGCASNNLISLDVTKNTNLTSLYCYYNALTSINLTTNTALTELVCYNNRLTSLDMTNNTALTVLYCFENKLTEINVTNNAALTQFECYQNQLTSLDVTKNTDLTVLYCFDNKLTSLNVTKNTDLTELDCSSNQLTSLDVTNNTALTGLVCRSNQLTSLNMNNNTDLTELDCSSNQLTSLDVTNNAALTGLGCDNNQLDYATLPISNLSIFIYAPQKPITIAASFPINAPIDLSSQLNINGNTTIYIWKTESGTTLTAGIDYTIDGGKTTFKTIPAAKVYCEMTNATFPDFTGANVLKTTLTTISTATAVDDVKAGAVDIYSRNQTVNLSLPEAAMVQVYDITGHLVNAEYYNSGNNSFEVANKGIYVIKVNMNDQVVSKKIVIK